MSVDEVKDSIVRHNLLIIILFLTFSQMSLTEFVMNNFFYHIKSGRLILEVFFTLGFVIVIFVDADLRILSLIIQSSFLKCYKKNELNCLSGGSSSGRRGHSACGWRGEDHATRNRNSSEIRPG